MKTNDQRIEQLETQVDSLHQTVVFLAEIVECFVGWAEQESIHNPEATRVVRLIDEIEEAVERAERDSEPGILYRGFNE